MPTLETIIENPSKIIQRRAGNCGFVAVLMHLIAMKHPLVKKLILYVQNDFNVPLNSQEAKIHSAVQKRKYFHFPNLSQNTHLLKDTPPSADDFDWYLILALSIYFTKNVDRKVLTECEEFSKLLKKNWEHGPKLKEGIAQIESLSTRDEQIERFKTIRETFSQTYKAGHLALTVNGMLALLKLCQISTLGNPWRTFDWSEVQKNNYYNWVYNKEFTHQKRLTSHISLLPRWGQFVRELESLPPNTAIIIAAKSDHFDGYVTPESLLFADFVFQNIHFNHWLYCGRDKDSKQLFVWTYGAKYKISKSNLLFFDIAADQRRAFLPVGYIPITSRV